MGEMEMGAIQGERVFPSDPETPEQPVDEGGQPEKEMSDQAVEGKSSMWGAVFNFANSILGAGVFGLAFAMENGGYPLSVMILVGCGVLTSISVQLIVAIGNAVGVNGYEELCGRLLGRWGFLAVSGSMVLFTYGAMVTFLIIIGDTVAAVLGDWSGSGLLGSRPFVIAVCACVICLPLSSLKNIGKLSKTSATSIFGVAIIIILVTVRAPMASDDQGIRRDRHLGWVGGGIASGSGTMDAATMAMATPGCLRYPLTTNGHEAPRSNRTSDRLVDVVFEWHGEYRAELAFTVANTSDDLFVVYALGSTDVAPANCSDPLTAGAQHDLRKGSVRLAGMRGVTKEGHRVTLTKTDEGEGSVRIKIDYSLREGWKQTEGGYDFYHKNFFPAFGTVAFAYVCHPMSFLVRNSLADRSQWPKVTVVSVTIATTLSLILCSVGYLFFLRCTRPNILNNFGEGDQAINVARLLLAVTMFFTFPMVFFVARQAAHSLFMKSDAPNTPMSNREHWTLTLVIFGLVLPPGLLLNADRLGLVQEFTGGVAAAALGFILPALLWFSYVRTVPESVTEGFFGDKDGSNVPYGMEDDPAKPAVRPWKKVVWTGWRTSLAPLILLVIGVVSLVVNTILAAMHAAGIGRYDYPEFCPQLSNYLIIDLLY